jgi:hypothetical protein
MLCSNAKAPEESSSCGLWTFDGWTEAAQKSGSVIDVTVQARLR